MSQGSHGCLWEGRTLALCEMSRGPHTDMCRTGSMDCNYIAVIPPFSRALFPVGPILLPFPSPSSSPLPQPAAHCPLCAAHVTHCCLPYRRAVPPTHTGRRDSPFTSLRTFNVGQCCAPWMIDLTELSPRLVGLMNLLFPISTFYSFLFHTLPSFLLSMSPCFFPNTLPARPPIPPLPQAWPGVLAQSKVCRDDGDSVIWLSSSIHQRHPLHPKTGLVCQHTNSRHKYLHPNPTGESSQALLLILIPLWAAQIRKAKDVLMVIRHVQYLTTAAYIYKKISYRGSA